MPRVNNLSDTLMDTRLDAALGFAPFASAPVRHTERTHAWYGALGGGKPCRCAQRADARLGGAAALPHDRTSQDATPGGARGA